MNKNETLRRIARYLMLHTSHQNNLGLLNGKMGVAIFFFYYAEYTVKKIYKDFAGELINEIYKEIHVNYPRNFKDGLSGIAWGMEYLVRNRFVEGDVDEVLEELDRQILERDIRRMMDNSLETGLKGLAYYVISRCANKKERDRIISAEYILDLIKALQSNLYKNNENIGLISDLKRILVDQQVSIGMSLIDNILEKTTFRYKSLFQPSRPLGIFNNGYAGISLKIMRENETKNIYI